MTTRHPAGPILLALAILACGEPRVTGADRTPTGPFEISVEVFTWPAADSRGVIYRWTGGTAYRLTVARLGDPSAVVWDIVTTTGAGIPAGVQHGVLPGNAAATVQGEERLLPVGDDRYRVSVVLQRTGETGTLEFDL